MILAVEDLVDRFSTTFRTTVLAGDEGETALMTEEEYRELLVCLREALDTECPTPIGNRNNR
jgi:hypothetical protein